MVLALQIILVICFVGILVDYLMNVKKHHAGEMKATSGKKWAWCVVIGVVCNFLDTLGCGSFAPTTFLYKQTRCVDDINIPGTLNVGDTFPVIFEALIFTTSVECDPLFLILMCVSAMLGSYLMAGIVCKWDVNKIRYAMGTAMLGCAIVMALKNAGVGPFGVVGEAIGLTGWKLIVAVALNFVWGALMDVGFGLYAPCMATCLLLGCSGSVCFPVFMSSCALLMPACSLKFIKESRYDVVGVMGNLVGGLVGVFIAWKFITSLPMVVLIYIVCVVLLWTSYCMFRDAKKHAVEQDMK